MTEISKLGNQQLEMMTWSTREKLLLGAAVRRYGDWNIVASELRARTNTPSYFTPEACKAKYEDLQQRNPAWIEEVRQKRIAELKRAVEQIDRTIGLLKSTIEFLNAEENDEKSDDCHVNNGSVEPELHVPSQIIDRVDSSTKETSKDGLSAGSFTLETQTKRSPSTEDTKPDVSKRQRVYEKVAYTADEDGILEKQSEMRTKKDCAGEVVVKCSDINKEIKNKNLKKEGIKDMDEILDYVLAIKGASAFTRRLDSQKGAKYEKMIRKHMDLDTIRFRISSQAIKSVKELLRDLLLLANNALVFYSKNTREYESALLIRDHVTRTLRGNPVPKCISSSVADAKPVHDPPAEVRSLRRSTRQKIVAKAAGGNNSAPGVSVRGKKSDDDMDYSPPPSVKMESLPVKKAIRRSERIVLQGKGKRAK